MFRIGEFSKIAQAPISQLRYYDEIGLFQPAKIDPFTGYRLYSATQLPQLNRIIALKELGFTLDQIRQTINENVVADEIRGMLALKKAQIEQKVREELVRLRIVEARLRQIEKEGEIGADDVVLKSIPTQQYLSMRRVFPNFYDIREIVQDITRRLPLRLGEKNLGFFTVVIHGNDFELTNADIEIGYILKNDVESPLRLPSGDKIEIRELTAVETAATAIRVGSVENGYETYAKIGRWVEENGYEIIGLAREEFITFPNFGQAQEAVVEIQIPIRLSDNTSQVPNFSSS